MNDKLKPSGRIVYKDSKGNRVPGVTTIIGVLAKPQLITWANRLGLDGIDSTKYVDNLASVGTLVHHLILCKFKEATPDLSDFTENQIMMASGSMLSFNSWESTHKVVPFLIEQPLVSEDLGVGATPDLLCNLDDVATIVDFKSGRGLYIEVVLQLAAYAHILREQGWEISQGRAVRVGRELGEGFEVVEFTREALDAGFEAFMNCLGLYRGMQEIRKSYWKK